MQSGQPNVLTRDDTFFGVCQALGEDFGFNPNYLRVALAVMLFVNPVAMLAGYAGAGVVVALSRWLVPNPAFAESAGDGSGAQDRPLAGDNDTELELAAAA